MSVVPGTERNPADDRQLRLVIAATLASDDTMVDVGAHSGGVLWDAVRAAPAGRHLAFEPLPAMAAHLRSAYPAVDVREVALSDREGTASFVHVIDAPSYSGLRQRDYPPGLGDHLEPVTVRTARLDDEIGDLQPRLIKIDVEGAELAVLRGAAQTLERYRPVVWFEHGKGAAEHYGTQPGDVWDVLVGAGLKRIYDADGMGPLSRDQFEEAFEHAKVWNYLARA